MTWFRPVATLALVATAIAVVPSSLLAHAELVKSQPAANSKGPAPSIIRLVFSEEPVLALTRLHLIGASGDTIALAAPRYDSADEHIVIAAVTGAPAAGSYTLSWSTAARDGHASKGSFSFSVTASAADTAKLPMPAVLAETTAAPSPAAPDTATAQHGEAHQVTATGVLVRFLEYISIFLIVGAVTFRLVVLTRVDQGDAFTEIASTNAAALGMFAAAGALVSAIFRVILESADMPDVSARTMLTGSSWGWSTIVAAVAAIVAGIAFRRVHSETGTARAAAWRLALIASAALVAAPAFAGHAISSDAAIIAVPADIIHVAAGSMWLGTLAVILLVGISASMKSPDSGQPGMRVAGLINVFSPMALVCGGAIVITGVTAALIHAPHPGALLTKAFWYTSYGSALYRKLFFVFVLICVGAWNWRRTRPQLATSGDIKPLRRVASIEVTLAAIVLVLTSILVALALPE
jgi:copper transport protein